MLIMVNASLGVSTLRELLERARRSPGKVAYATAGVGTVQHLVMAMIARKAGVEMLHVPYANSGLALKDVLSGEVPVVLHDRQLYAIPSMLGAVVVAVCWSAGWRSPVVLSAVVIGIFALRVLSLRFKLHAPGPWRGRPGGQAGWSP